MNNSKQRNDDLIPNLLGVIVGGLFFIAVAWHVLIPIFGMAVREFITGVFGA